MIFVFHDRTGQNGTVNIFCSRQDGTVNHIFFCGRDGTGRCNLFSRRDGTVHLFFLDGTGRLWLLFWWLCLLCCCGVEQVLVAGCGWWCWWWWLDGHALKVLIHGAGVQHSGAGGGPGGILYFAFCCVVWCARLGYKIYSFVRNYL